MLELSHVTKRFGAKTAVDDVSFRVPEASVKSVCAAQPEWEEK